QIPSGEKHELCRGVHAEQNAIIQAACHGVSVSGSTLYCTDLPAPFGPRSPRISPFLISRLIPSTAQKLS
ncbi:MAG: hypothetical protein HQK64_14090, partial [Desulfamplus sp.]|nr:hypothetical protein [Desulfamplus sp.]